jgi:TATA-box binding protein (TBP) (component of TFIID and TFIIIB)
MTTQPKRSGLTFNRRVQLSEEVNVKDKEHEITSDEVEQNDESENIEIAREQYRKDISFLDKHNITISTITLDCKLRVDIDLPRFSKYLKLRTNGIVSIKYGNRNDTATNRTIVVFTPKKKPSTRSFFNQATVRVKPRNNPNRNYINIKVFRNGSLQMTGCKSMDDFYDVVFNIIDILKMGRTVRIKGKGVCYIDFVLKDVDMGIYDVNVRMINSNFRVDYKIERRELASLLRRKHGVNSKDDEFGHIEHKYEPSGGHSCVNIKYRYDADNMPSVFVFQTGAIIITGAKRLDHIIKAYHFILKLLARYDDRIRIREIDTNKFQEEMNRYKQIRNSASQ